MKHAALTLFISIFMVALSFSLTRAAEGSPPAAAQSGSMEEQRQMPPAAQARGHGETAITKTCGCNAACPEGFNPSEVTSCYKEGKCKDDGAKCTLTCKKGKEEQKVDGKCYAIYH
jgi:hypothetical protein